MLGNTVVSSIEREHGEDAEGGAEGHGGGVGPAVGFPDSADDANGNHRQQKAERGLQRQGGADLAPLAHYRTTPTGAACATFRVVIPQVGRHRFTRRFIRSPRVKSRVSGWGVYLGSRETLLAQAVYHGIGVESSSAPAGGTSCGGDGNALI